MARAKRHYVPGNIWHITQRCHKKEFLLRFVKDKKRWMLWLYQAKRRYGLVILNYMVTSNHIHLLVKDDAGRDTIPKSIQLVAGRTAQEFNQRKHRQGAFWQDRYHSVAIESGEHLIRCLVYMDMNMVRAGKVKHPSQWSFSGYNEIQHPRRKCIMISYDMLMNLAGYSNFRDFQSAHREWIGEAVRTLVVKREPQWTEGIAVGSKEFTKTIKDRLAARARGRKEHELENGYVLRQPHRQYNALFGPKKGII